MAETQEFNYANETGNPRYTGLEPPRQADEGNDVPVAKPVGEAQLNFFEQGRQYALNTSKSTRQLLNKAGNFAFYNFESSQDYKPYFTRVVIVVNIVVFFVELYIMYQDYGVWIVDPSQNPTFGPNVETLLKLGAKRADLIVDDGEWWRLITPMFLHGGILHVLFNMLFLYSFGTQLESIFGTFVVAYIYLVSGYIGVLLSCLFAPTIVGVGASGACYGLFGAAWADFILNYSLNERPCCEGVKLFFATALNLALGLMPYLDNFAHVGGFITGFITGLSTMTLKRYTRDRRLKPKKTYQIVLQAMGIILSPILIISMTASLFLRIDVESYCEWCQYITCVPFPPIGDPWWTCDPCEEGTSYDPANPGFLNCPRGVGEIEITINFTEPTTIPELLALCRLVCEF